MIIRLIVMSILIIIAMTIIIISIVCLLYIRKTVFDNFHVYIF